LQPEVPVPIAQRLRGLIDDLRVIQLLLDEVSFEDYKASLRSRDAIQLARVVYPLERAFEVGSNYVVELARLALKELGATSSDGPTDLRGLADANIISRRMADQLVDIHRAGNGLQHDYPDVRASTIYPACEQLARLTPSFLRAYSQWLRSLGYGSRG
jgi:uncharacterized protein YutE (UPF0331/DUF86 family)